MSANITNGQAGIFSIEVAHLRKRDLKNAHFTPNFILYFNNVAKITLIIS